MSVRLSYFFGFIVICLLLLTSFYLELFQGIMPCPLCTLQRFSFGLLGLWFFLGILLYAYHIPRLVTSLLSLLTAGIGFTLASRQVWLQHYPPADGSECGVSLHYLMQVLPLNEVLQKVLVGTAECTNRSWDFLSLDMAEWAMIWFATFILLAIYLCWMAVKKR